MPDGPLSAAIYDRMLALIEARGLAERRRVLLAGARGRVLDIGAATGLNLAHFRPETVTSVVALEPDAGLQQLLLQRIGAPACPVPCEVHEVGVGEAEFAAGSFDTVVSVLALCTVDDPGAAVGAVKRWLAPGGRLLFLEHVRAPGLKGRLHSAASPLWRHTGGRCHLDRDTLTFLRGADLAITDCERFALPAGGVLLSTCVQGVARPRPVAEPEGAA